MVARNFQYCPALVSTYCIDFILNHLIFTFRTLLEAKLRKVIVAGSIYAFFALLNEIISLSSVSVFSGAYTNVLF